MTVCITTQDTVMVYWKDKKYSKKYSAIIRRFIKDDKLRYQFVVNARWKGAHLWHGKLHEDLMTCAFEGFMKIHEAEEDPMKAFGLKPTKTEEERLERKEMQFKLAQKRRETNKT